MIDECLAISIASFHRVLDGHLTCNMRDYSMPFLNQMSGGSIPTIVVFDAHALFFEAGNPCADNDQWHLLSKFAQIVVVYVPRALWCLQKNPINAPSKEHIERATVFAYNITAQ